MRLVYTATQKAVCIGDKVMFDGTLVKVAHFAPPRSLASSGKVILQLDRHQGEYFVGVIGAEWIEREDRAAADALEQVMYRRQP